MKHGRRRTLAAVCSGLLVLVGPALRAGQNATTPSGRPLTLGLIAPPNEPDAASLINGALLAVATANASHLPRVALEIRSESGQWGSVGNDAAVLVNERHVDALVTSTDGADTHLILQVSGRTHVPVATLCADMSVTRAGIPWELRVVAGNDQQAGALFAAARHPNGAPTRWWVVVPSGRPARVIRHDLEIAARAGAAMIDRTVEIDSRTAPRQVAKIIADAAPAGVLLWVAPKEAGLLVAELRGLSYRGRLAGPCTLDSSHFLETAKAAATGVIVPTWRTDPQAEAKYANFKREYRGRFGVEPDFVAAAAHDAVLVLIGALRETKSGEGYRVFPVTYQIIGATGAMHFDSAGNRTDPLQVLTYAEGRLSADSK